MIPAYPETMRHTFPAGAHLRFSTEFRAVRERGRAATGRFLIVSALSGAGGDGAARVGIITGRRIGGAVVRNRVRRRLREIVRRARPSLVPGLWVVLVARAGAAVCGQRALADEWLRLASRLSILRSSDHPA